MPAPKGLTNFPKACARLLLSQSRNHSSRALDLGCAVGRSSFELAHKIPEVIGIDYSRSFIRAAKKLQKTGKISFSLLEEGKTTKPSFARVSSQRDRKRLCFQAGDALRIPKKLGTFDLVLAANLIDRLPEPQRFLKRFYPNWSDPAEHSSSLLHTLGPPISLLRRNGFPTLFQQSKEASALTSVFSVGRISLFFFANIAASFSTPSPTPPSGGGYPPSRYVGRPSWSPSPTYPHR